MKKLMVISAMMLLFLLSACVENGGKSKEYNTNSFKFSLNDSFKQDMDSVKKEGDICLKYKNEFNVIYAYEYPMNISLKGYTEGFADTFRSNPLYSNVTCEEYKNANLSTYVIGFTQEDEDGIHNSEYYILNSQNMNISILVTFQDEYREKLMPMVEDMIKSVEYTSDYYLPTTPQDFENEYCKISFDPKWVLSTSGKNEEKIHIKYALAETVDKFLTTFAIEPHIDNVYTSAKEMADFDLKELSESSNTTNFTREEVDFLGFDGIKLSEEFTLAESTFSSVSYYFMSNKIIYNVRYIISNDNSSSDKEEIMSDIEALLNELTIK